MFIFADVLHETILYEGCIIFGLLANTHAQCLTQRGDILVVAWTDIMPKTSIFIDGFDIQFRNNREVLVCFDIRKPVEK